MDKNRPLLKFKKFYWGLKPEIKEWYRTFIFNIPGVTGEFFRRRYAQKNFKKCGPGMKMYPYGKIYNPQLLELGDRAVISDYVQISAGGGVKIGNNVILGPNVKIWSINHNYEKLSVPISDQGWITDSVIIGDGTWLAMNSIVLPGVKIGCNVVVGAGSVVTKDLPDNCLAAGNPCRVIKYREMDVND